MEPANLIVVCAIAFGVVIALLAVLAAAFRLITMLFPERVTVVDGAVVAAISSSVAAAIPGAHVTRIEEES